MTKTVITQSELEVLKHLSAKIRTEHLHSTSEISEIATELGVESSEEVQRALYILEGKSLVQPEPKGDFTSNHWKITDVGLRAMSILGT